VVALLEEEATLKRLHLEHDKITLVAENPAYPPIEPEKLQILGKVIGLFRHYLAN
jgi:repressor LexA